MIGKLIFFIISLAASCLICCLASILNASGIKDRRIKGLKILCFTLPFWLILTAVKMIISVNYLTFAVIAQQIFVNVVTYLTLWFILNLIESKLTSLRIVKAVVIAIPTVDIMFILTNPWHMKYYTSYEPILERYFLPEGPLFNVRLVILIIAVLFVYSLLIKYIIKNFKNHPLLLLSGFGALIPLILNMLYMYSGIEYDFTAMGYLFTVLLFAYSCYAPRIRKARSGIFTETLANIAKSQEITSGTIPEAARLISREGCLAMDAYRVGVWSFDEKNQILKSINCYNAYTQEHFSQDDFDLQKSERYKEILLSKKLIIINDVNAPNILGDTMKDYDPNICSFIDAPVWVGSRFAGIISIEQNKCITFPEKREWNPEEQSFASSLADLMAIAFTNEERQSLIKAESVSRAKSQFITNISHEIRTPMNAVLGLVEIALRENDLDKKNEHLQVVKQSGIHLMSIISDILDFSKIESGKQEVVQEEYLITSLLDEIVNITSMGIVGSKIRFAVKADNNIPKLLFGDETKIRQAVLNLLDNAVKYTERGSVSLGVYGEIANNDTMNLIFTVSDTGIGIRPENIDMLFNNNQNVEGSGLGLALTKNIVDAMNGQIDVYSEYGKGSIFTISLPQKYHSNNPMALVKKPEEKKVIIFERRDVYAESLAFTVKNLGTDCTMVSSGTELYEEMEKQRYDYLFISFGLYKKNEDTINKFGKETEILILTEFDEVISEKNLKTLTMPVYCTVIAEVLNGIYENVLYSKGNEIAVKFSAPEAKVLVVDDIKTNLKVAQGLLTPYNMHVDLCVNGISAIEAVRSEKYDLVFMDHRMPGIDGVEAVRRIRAWEKDQSLPPLHIVALTANAVLGMKEMFLKNGFDDFLPKPIDTVLLNSILEKWIPREKQVKK